MSLSGVQHKQIHDALLDGFSESGLRQLLRHELNVELDAVVGNGPLEHRVFDLVAWANKHGRVADLIAGALRQNPVNPTLQSLADTAKSWYIEAPTLGVSPYKGLAFYDVDDAPLFFGRQKLTNELVAYLKDHRFLAVFGASGSGKSSVVRAGVVAALKNGAIKGSETWPVFVVTPTARPVNSLAVAVTCDSESAITAVTLADDMLKDVQSLGFYLRRLTSSRAVIVIDQFEQLFILNERVEQRKAFVDGLLNAATEDGIATVVLTIRADFFEHCAEFSNLRDALSHQKFIGEMSSDELRAAIEQPALQEGWELESGLSNRVLRDVGNEPGLLPLLSQALYETWKRRSGRMLTLQHYEASGGVWEAIAITANEVYDNLSDSEKSTARSMFIRLTAIHEGVKDTRQRVPLDEFSLFANHSFVLRQLENARLITLERDPQGAIFVEMAHEALIREWPQLRTWIGYHREAELIRRRLEAKSEERKRLRQFDNNGGLLDTVELAEAERWISSHDAAEPWMSEDLASLISDSRNAIEETVKSKELANLKLRRRNQGLLMALFATLVAVVIALVFLSVARTEETNARNAEATAQANAAEALYQRATATFLGPTEGNTGAIRSVSISPNDDFVASAGDNGIINLWNIELRQPVTTFVGHVGTVNTVIFSPDSRLIVSGGEDTTVRLWNAQTGEQLFVLNGHNDDVLSVAISPDGLTAVSAGVDGTLRYWDTKKGELVRTINAHSDGASSVVFSSDGKTVVSGGWDAIIRLWDAETGQLLRTTEGHSHGIFSVAVSSDGESIFSAGAEKIMRLWDFQSGDLVSTVPARASGSLQAKFSPDDSIIASVDGDTVRLWSRQTGELLRTLDGHTGTVTSVDFSADGKTVLSGSIDGTLRLWEILADGSANIQASTLEGHIGEIGAMEVSPDGILIASAGYDKTVRIWDLNTGRLIHTLLGNYGEVTHVMFSPTGQTVVSEGLDSTIRLWDVGTAELLLAINSDITWGNPGAFGLDGKAIVSSGTTDRHSVDIWSLETGLLLRTIRDVRLHLRPQFTPDGRNIATAVEDGTVKLWDARTGDLIKVVGQVGSSPYRSISISPDGSMLAGAFYNGRIELWDLRSGEYLLTISDSADKLISTSFSQDGRAIIGECSDGSSWLWDTLSGGRLLGPAKQMVISSDASIAARFEFVRVSSESTRQLIDVHTGALRKILPSSVGHVTDAVFSPNSKMLALSINSEMVEIWDVQTAELLRVIEGNGDTITGLAFSPDGGTLISAGGDGTLRVWATSIVTLLETAERQIQRSEKVLTETEMRELGVTQ